MIGDTGITESYTAEASVNTQLLFFYGPCEVVDLWILVAGDYKLNISNFNTVAVFTRQFSSSVNAFACYLGLLFKCKLNSTKSKKTTFLPNLKT